MEINYTEKELMILKKIARAAEELEVETYLIGGFVRDKILGRPTKDADIVCVGDGIELATAVAKHFNPIPQVSYFKNFGTAHIKVNLPDNNDSSKALSTIGRHRLAEGDAGEGLGEAGGFDIEFVGARKESYRFDSRKPAVEPGSVEDDQQRRDFTINALAISLNKNDYGKLIDPFDGVKDIENKIIKTPMAPAQTFSDDPLRMMRAIRFATQLNFDIEEKTLQSIKENADRIKIISQERITDELNKIVSSAKPSTGFDLLYKTGLLHIIFPQMVELAGAEYKDGQGHKDNFYHTLQVLDNIAVNTNDLWLRWAAILHDIAKPVTKRFEEGHGWTFHGHEVVGGKMVPKIFTRLKLPLGEKMRLVRKLVELHLRPISLTKENITDSAIRRLLFDAGEDFDSLMLLCDADITSKNKQKVKRYQENFQLVRQRCKEVEEKDHLRNWQPPISGEEIMDMFGLSPSRPVGVLKNALKDAILDGVIPNTYDGAWSYLVEKGKEMDLKIKKS
jgi:poly(A) polymerase